MKLQTFAPAALLLWLASFLQSLMGAAAQASRPIHQVTPGAKDYHVREWIVLGMFPNPDLETPTEQGYTRYGFVTDFLDELGGENEAILEADTTVPYSNSASGVAQAQRITSQREDGRLDLSVMDKAPGRNVAYLFTWIESDRNQRLTCFYGSHESFRVWYRGEKVAERWVEGGMGIRPRRESFAIDVQKGLNPIIMKVERIGGFWGQASFEVIPREDAPKALSEELDLSTTISPPRQLDTGEWETTLTFAVNFDPTLFAGLKQEVTVQDTQGSLLVEKTVSTGETIRLLSRTGLFQVKAVNQDNASQVSIKSFAVARDPSSLFQQAIDTARNATQDPKLTSSKGWFTYLHEKLSRRLQEGGATTTGEAADLAFAAEYWANQLKQDPEAWKAQRGSFEWAYHSLADGSGQPFTAWVPEAYQPDEPWPLVVNMHGAGGDHGSDWGQPAELDHILVQVNGRGPVSGYTALSEVDVLEATDYVKEHWNIDPDRVHITGGSMGGYGTYTVASRHPDLFATATPRGGNGAHMPIENMLNLPTYSIHSDDDMVVVVSGSRAAIHRIVETGGTAILDETTGLGHAFGSFDAGNRRLENWRLPRVRPSFNEIDRVVFRAMDGYSRQAYWLSIEEAGPDGYAPRAHVRFDGANGLYIDTDNVATLRIQLDNAPVDRSKKLWVLLDSSEPRQLPPPLPQQLYVAQQDNDWRLGSEAPNRPPYRPHFAGGANALYHGEPLMIVWGTRGDKATDERLEALARAGQRYTRLAWVEGGYDARMTYGRIPAKADVDVTAEDLQRCNLILIGHSGENELAARLAPHLPVSLSDDASSIQTSDGLTWNLEHRGFGCLYYNPEAPMRLIYWLASPEPRFYETNTPFMQYHRRRSPAPDLVVMELDSPTIAAARRFDGNWNWVSGYEKSAKLTNLIGKSTSPHWYAHLLRKASAADFAVVENAQGEPSLPLEFAPEARLADMAATFYEEPIGVCQIPGAELKVLLERRKTSPQKGALSLIPEPKLEELEDGQTYRLALINDHIRDLVRLFQKAPSDYHLTDLTLRDALERASVQASP